MPIVRNKTEKIKMASYREAATEHFEVVIFKAASQLDLAALRILKWERCTHSACNRFWQIFVSLQVSSLIILRKV